MRVLVTLVVLLMIAGAVLLLVQRGGRQDAWIYVRTECELSNQVWTDRGNKYPDMGCVFLIVRYDITNDGYSSFAAKPWGFCVVIDGVRYSREIIYRLPNEVDGEVLLDGGSISGVLVYEIPAEADTSGMEFVSIHETIAGNPYCVVFRNPEQ